MAFLRGRRTGSQRCRWSSSIFLVAVTDGGSTDSCPAVCLVPRPGPTLLPAPNEVLNWEDADETLDEERYDEAPPAPVPGSKLNGATAEPLLLLLLYETSDASTFERASRPDIRTAAARPELCRTGSWVAVSSATSPSLVVSDLSA